MNLQVVFLLLSSMLMTVTAQLCFKQGVSKLGELKFSLAGILNLIGQVFHSFWLLGGIIIFGASFLLWLFLISKIQLNLAYPITIGSQVIVLSLASWLIFHEYLSFWQIIGVAVVVLGMFLISKF